MSADAPRCAQPGVAKCAREWEADKQRRALEAVGLAEEFPFGCDSIEHVAEALIACRAERDRLRAVVIREGTCRVHMQDEQITALAADNDRLRAALTEILADDPAAEGVYTRVRAALGTDAPEAR